MLNHKDIEFYTIQEVADMLKVAYLTVYRWIKAGKIEAIRIEKQYRISKEALDKFIKSKSNNGY